MRLFASTQSLVDLKLVRRFVRITRTRVDRLVITGARLLLLLLLLKLLLLLLSQRLLVVAQVTRSALMTRLCTTQILSVHLRMFWIHNTPFPSLSLLSFSLFFPPLLSLLSHLLPSIPIPFS